MAFVGALFGVGPLSENRDKLFVTKHGSITWSLSFCLYL
jgi:hypothetical protein